MPRFSFTSDIRKKRKKHRQKQRRKFKKLELPALCETKFEKFLPSCFLYEGIKKPVLKHKKFQYMVKDLKDGERIPKNIPMKVFMAPNRRIKRKGRMRMPHRLSVKTCRKYNKFVRGNWQLCHDLFEIFRRENHKHKTTFADALRRRGILPFMCRISYMRTIKRRNIFKYPDRKVYPIKEEVTLVNGVGLPAYGPKPCLFHNREIRCSQDRVGSAFYCKQHVDYYSQVGKVVTEQERYLFEPVNSCNTAEPMIQEFDPRFFHPSDIMEAGTYFNHVDQQLDHYIDNLAAKEMMLNVRIRDFARMEVDVAAIYANSNISGNPVMCEEEQPITNKAALEAALELIRLREYSSLPPEPSHYTYLMDEEIDFFDWHETFDALEVATDDDGECSEYEWDGKGFFHDYSDSENEVYDACIDVDDEEVEDITHAIVQDELDKLPVHRVQQLVYHQIPWRSVMRGELDPECYQEYMESDFPQSLGETLLCDSEGYSFSTKISWANKNPTDKVKIINAGKKEVADILPLYNPNILALFFMNLSDYFTGRTIPYEMNWSLTYLNGHFSVDILEKCGPVNWKKYQWIGLMEREQLDDYFENKRQMDEQREKERQILRMQKAQIDAEFRARAPVQYRPMSNIMISTRDPSMPLLTPMANPKTWNQTVYMRQPVVQSYPQKRKYQEYGHGQQVYYTPVTSYQSHAPISSYQSHAPVQTYSSHPPGVIRMPPTPIFNLPQMQYLPKQPPPLNFPPQQQDYYVDNGGYSSVRYYQNPNTVEVVDSF